MSARDRPKATELFNRRGRPYASGKPFQEAYPQIKNFKIEIERQTGRTSPDKLYFTPQKPCDEYVDCVNLGCYDGGISIGKIIKEMMIKGQTDFKGVEFCQGNEAGPKGKKIQRNCIYRFDVNIHLDIE